MKRFFSFFFLTVLFPVCLFSQVPWWNLEGKMDVPSGTVYCTNLDSSGLVAGLTNIMLYSLQCRQEPTGTQYILLVGTDYPIDVVKGNELVLELNNGQTVILPAGEDVTYDMDKYHITETSKDLITIPYIISGEQIDILSNTPTKKLSIKGKNRSVSRNANLAKLIKTQKKELDGMMAGELSSALPWTVFAQRATRYIRSDGSSVVLNQGKDSSQSVVSIANESKYSIHRTEQTKTMFVNSFSDVKLIDCSDGHFIVWDNTVAHIFDKDGNETGTVAVQNYADRGFLRFSEGVAMGVSDNGPVAFGYDGKIKREFKPKTGIKDWGASGFVDGLAYLWDQDKNEYVFIDSNLHCVFNNLSIGSKNTSRRYESNAPIAPEPLKENRRFFPSTIKEKVKDSISPAVYDFDYWGIIDGKGNLIKEPIFWNVSSFGYNEGLVAVSITEGNQEIWGFVDKQGEWVIKPIYSNQPGDFHDGYSVVKKRNGKYVFINKSGDVISPEYNYASDFNEGYAIIASDLSGYKIIDTSFKVFKPFSSQIDEQTAGVFYIYTDALSPRYYPRVAYSSTGERLYDLYVFPFNEGVAVFDSNTLGYNENKRSTGYINEKGEIVLEIVESEF